MNQSHIPTPPAVTALVLRREAERLHRDTLGRPMGDEWHARQWAIHYLSERAERIERGR